MKNKDISYDYNKISLCNVPIRKIRPSDVDISLYLDTYAGLENGGNSSLPNTERKYFIDDEGIKIYESLIEQGFTVFPKYANTYQYKERGMHLYRFSNEIKHPRSNKYGSTRPSFRIIPSSVTDTVISNTKTSYARIGDVMSSTDTRTPLLGVLIRCINLATQKVTYKINFFEDEIGKRANNGIATEMLKDCFTDEFRQMMESYQNTTVKPL